VALDDRIRDALDRAVADVRAAAQAEVDEVRQSAKVVTADLRAASARLADCIHAIDEAPSLGAVLTVLTGCARLEAGRAAVILVTNGKLTTYPSRDEVPPEQARLANSAASGGKPSIEADAAAFPIAVGGQVVAVLSTAAPATAEIHNAVDLLARHAGRVLEAMTVCKITGLAPASPPARESSAGNIS